MPDKDQNYIFRLQEDSDLSNTIKHWNESVQYREKQIEAIATTNPASTKEPTSVPSPFARIALAKTAFGAVAKYGEKASNTYKKIVSDCLDVGEIFFNYEKYQNFFQIIEWNKKNDLLSLKNSNNAGNNKFLQTLELYLDQDAGNYNFSLLDSIFILKCTHPFAKSTNNIIGATSPATLFFSAANDLSYLAGLIDFGKNKPFDGNYTPLYKRNLEYQKYWRLLQMTTDDFAGYFKEVDDYLTASYNLLDSSGRAVINAVTKSDMQNYTDITVGGAGNRVKVLTIYLKQQNPVKDIDSDFKILSVKTINDVSPLVLPVDRFAEPLQYGSSLWKSDTRVPYFDDAPVSQRILPAEGSVYPYLTISDFLEDSITQLPFKINRNAFFDSNCDNKGYLLPLKKLFFDFFTVEDLNKTLADGKKMFELQPVANAVKVFLRIPVRKGVIVYNRVYHEYNGPDIAKNKGALVQYDFDFALFPNIKFQSPIEAFYRFGLISKFDEASKFNLFFFDTDNQQLTAEKVIRNQRDRNYEQCSHYFLDKTNFDHIQVDNSGKKLGMIIPSLNQNNGGSRQITFAVDLGTTNTHVEYTIDGNPAKGLDITLADQQIHLLSDDTDRFVKYELIFDSDLIPGRLGEGENYGFPLRTALSESSSIDWRNPVVPMVHANIPFDYEKRLTHGYSNITPNLKWSELSDVNNNKERIKIFIETLFLILRNKVVLNDGKLEATKIIWFYPLSMTKHRFILFKTEWENAYRKYFGSAIDNIIPMTESVAPYQFFKTSVNNASDVVTVDIGGGTTDIVIAQRGEIKQISSFRFAANSVFGDGYAINPHGSVQNGMIRQFKSRIYDILKANEMDNLMSVYHEMDSKNISAEIASFLFSLYGNKTIQDKNIADKVNFNRILQEDGTQKIVFVFFYGAIIYHIAHILKGKGLPVPRHISFSGNGSKVIQILSEDDKTLEKFTKLIIEKVFGEPYSGELTIKRYVKNPKQATCKGGISNPVSEDYDQIADKKVTLLNSTSQTFVTTETYGNINREKLINRTSIEASDFIHFLLNLNSEFSFKNNFGVDTASIDVAKKSCFIDLETYAFNGLEEKLKEVSPDDAVEETFFFYPLTGMFYALSNILFESQT